MAIVSVSLPDALLEDADVFLAERGYSGRSEVVRAALRDFVARERGRAPGPGVRGATITLVYPDGYERKIADIRHDYSDVVKSMMHGHSKDNCVEIFMLEGQARRIQQFSDALRASKETRLVELVYTDAR